VQSGLLQYFVPLADSAPDVLFALPDMSAPGGAGFLVSTIASGGDVASGNSGFRCALRCKRGELSLTPPDTTTRWYAVCRDRRNSAVHQTWQTSAGEPLFGLASRWWRTSWPKALTRIGFEMHAEHPTALACSSAAAVPSVTTITGVCLRSA
jgi:hypothetical protein